MKLCNLHSGFCLLTPFSSTIGFTSSTFCCCCWACCCNSNCRACSCCCCDEDVDTRRETTSIKQGRPKTLPRNQNYIPTPTKCRSESLAGQSFISNGLQGPVQSFYWWEIISFPMSFFTLIQCIVISVGTNIAGTKGKSTKLTFKIKVAK